MEFRKHFGYDVQAASDEATLELDPVSLTVQSQSEDADINVMLKRFGVTGQLPVNVRAPEFGDFTNVRDFRSAMDALLLAQDSFMQMPADVRKRFDNDPQKFLEFCSDEKNVVEMEGLGLTNTKIATEKKRKADEEAERLRIDKIVQERMLAERQAAAK